MLHPNDLPPGSDTLGFGREQTGFLPDIELPDDDEGLGAWTQEYLECPDPNRLGVSFSGGGIRSASYCLGALQMLEESDVFRHTAYLAAVSGGDYLAVAQAAVVAATYGDFDVPEEIDTAQPSAPERLHPAPETFAAIPPFAPNSPEERNLRDDSSYLARGTNGKIWLGLNVIYGAVRHLLPFVAGLFAVAAAVGFALHQWFGQYLLHKPGGGFPAVNWDIVYWNLILAGAIAFSGIVALTVRQMVSNSNRPSGGVLASLQGLTLLLFRAAFVVAALLAGLPASLWLIAQSRSLVHIVFPTLGAGSSTVTMLFTYLMKRGKAVRTTNVLGFLMPLASVIVLGVPFLGFTYWVTQQGLHLHAVMRLGVPQQPEPFYALVAAVVVLIWFSLLDEVTPSMHLFYREKLAKAFIGMRVVDDRGHLGWQEPPWSTPLSFSKGKPHDPPGPRPKLVVCAAVNTSDESVPAGRNAGSFTFEYDYSGSPLTGYVPTRELELAAGESVLTMPALMAISGAALSPSMGKMTRTSLRLVMAIFNVRLGVWVPNPNKWRRTLSARDRRVRARRRRERARIIRREAERVKDQFEKFEMAETLAAVEAALEGDVLGVVEAVSAIRDARGAETALEAAAETVLEAADRAHEDADPSVEEFGPNDQRWRRPGTLYILREALGLNSLAQRYVYVTDGGHYENLGLVELLRRGCGQILCFDAAGDDLTHFHTISEAIALARSDLGVDITLDLDDLVPGQTGSETGRTARDDGNPGGAKYPISASSKRGYQQSRSDHVRGTIRYPDNTTGVLIFAKAAITHDTPQDAKGFADVDRRFPHHSTADQFFDERTFEAYRGIGAQAARGSLDELNSFREGEGMNRFGVRPARGAGG
jgi:hypothetical protein